VDLTDKQWDLVKDLVPKPRRGKGARGRPRVDDRAVLNGILWVLRTGAQWAELPEKYPSCATCHRRFQQWSCPFGERVWPRFSRDFGLSGQPAREPAAARAHARPEADPGARATGSASAALPDASAAAQVPPKAAALCGSGAYAAQRCMSASACW
jgi:transposase